MLHNIAQNITQVIINRDETDQRLLDLSYQMGDTVSFANNPKQMKKLTDVFIQILQQAAECTFFISEYYQRRFTGMLPTVILQMLIEE